MRSIIQLKKKKVLFTGLINSKNQILESAIFRFELKLSKFELIYTLTNF